MNKKHESTTETMKPFAEACYNGLVEIVNSESEGLPHHK